MTSLPQEKTSIAARSAALSTVPQFIDVNALVQTLLERYVQLWWSCGRGFPDFRVTHSAQEQSANEKQLDQLVNGLIYELKHAPQSAEARDAWQGKLRANAVNFARGALDLEQRHIDFLEASGMIEANQAFARMARRFDPHISADDIYQASRNVMSMNFIQLLLGLPVEVTPSVFAYSMLYPYTDNYLDDPTISRATKAAFNQRFQLRLQGEPVRPDNFHEKIISDLVEMIEGQFNRAQFPQVYDSLLAIHAAQSRSLKLVAPGASPFELDVLGISFEKGSTSVLADGYLVAGWVTPEQADFLFGYGAFTQLMDDLEDIDPDMREGRMSIFSQTAGRWMLDGVTNRAFHFGRAVFGNPAAFTAPAAAILWELIERSIDPVLIDTIGRAEKFYSKDYIRRLETHLPFRFAPLKKQRAKLDRQKVTLSALVEAFFLNDRAPAAFSGSFKLK